MKILSVSGKKNDELRVDLGADSAILRCGEPVFVDGNTADWELLVAPAIRISRLGTHIPPSKARSYYDAVSVFLVMRPCVPSPDIPWAMRDRTFSPGIWMPCANDIRLNVGCNPISSKTDPDNCRTDLFELSAIQETADIAVAFLSRYCTFKTGDILLFIDMAVSLGCPRLDTAIHADINGTPSLNVRIK